MERLQQVHKRMETDNDGRNVKNQALQKQQSPNYFVKNSNNKRKTTELCFLYFTSSIKKYYALYREL